MEVVVVLRDVSHNAQLVWNLHLYHVFWIQQSRNSQLVLSNVKCLQTAEEERNDAECLNFLSNWQYF